MGKKYFCWNIDDGLEQDKRIVKHLRKCGMGATFNLNSGMMGEKQMIGRIGDYGMKTVSLPDFKPGFHIMKYHDSHRIPEDEVVQVYQGFEIASHGFRHENLKKLSEEDARKSIAADVEKLSEIFNAEIRGFAYPFGLYGPQTAEILKKSGIKYARTVKRADDFRKPSDPLYLPMTAWHIDKDAFEKLTAFLREEAEDDLFFLMFAHGYEFDFGTKESSWQKFEVRQGNRVAKDAEKNMASFAARGFCVLFCD